MDTRADHFAQWLSEHSFDNRNIHSVTQTAATALIAAYIHDCANNGYTIKPGDLLNDETLSRYTAAAVYWFQAHVPSLKNLNIGDPSRLTSLHPSIRDTITTRRRWQQPKPKRLPYTNDMYITLKTRVDDAITDDNTAMFSKEAVVYDWVRLGLFTGLRGNEYLQTTGTCLEFSATPNEPSPGDWAGKPIAFILDDFPFLRNGVILTTQQILDPKRPPDEVWIRFRFDKGPKNFVTKKFHSTGHYIFDAISAALRIVEPYF